MEASIASLIALMLSLKFTDMRTKKDQEAIAQLQQQVTELSEQAKAADSEMLKKVMTTVLPVAKAVQRLNTEVGIQ